MQDEEDEYPNDAYDEIDLVPSPPERSIWWDYGVILVAGTLCGMLTQWVLSSIAAQFGIGNVGEWAASLTPATAMEYADAIRSLSAINSIGSFLLPTLFFIHFFYDLWGFEYLNADRLPRFANFNSSIIWLLCALPMIQGSFVLNAWLTKIMGMPQNELASNFQLAILHTSDYKVLVINDKGFLIDSKRETHNSKLENTEGVSDGQVFVFGKEVNDFHTVDYEALSTLNISATQELVKKINDLEAENAVLKTDVKGMKADIEQIKAAIAKKGL